MKAISYARLEEDHHDAELQLEGHVNGRHADVLLTFPEPRAPFGKGIAVEAQYRNKGKDIENITEHYFDHSYSVAWLEEEDFSNHDVDLTGIHTVWPNALPDRRGLSGYSDIIQSLWKSSSSPAELEIPIPGAFWASYDKSGEWVTIAEGPVKVRGEIVLVKSPDGDIVLGLVKGTRNGVEQVKVQASKSDIAKIRDFADQLDYVAFGEGRPPPDECDPEWHDLAQVWLSGSPTVKAWMKATLPEPDDPVVLQLWKKYDGSTEWVGMQVTEEAVESLRAIADAFEKALEIEREVWDPDWLR